MQIFPILKLLIVEFPLPKDSQLNAPVSKDTDQANQTGFRHQSKSKFKRTDHTDEHPSDPPNDEDDRGGDQIQISAATGIEPPQIGKQHPRKDH